MYTRMHILYLCNMLKKKINKQKSIPMLITIWIRTKCTNYFKSVRMEKKSGNVPNAFYTQNKR